jgi:hypothetical protein
MKLAEPSGCEAPLEKKSENKQTAQRGLLSFQAF